MNESTPGHKHSSHSISGGAGLKRKRQKSTSSQTSSEPTVCFHVGSESRAASQSSFLAYVWNTGLDSSCVSCGKPFHPGKDVPIRTVGLERNSPLRPSVIDIAQDPISPWDLRIFNRHFSCVKINKVNYIPISHAWHESVAAAQDTRTESINVARIVYQTPVRTLLALAEDSPDCEIWHDYISVPQWRADIQKQLLLAIPEIYNYATKTVVHLDDVKAVHITNQAKISPYNRFIVDFTTIIRSRWFDRMWVALEYIRSKDVIILTEDYKICEPNAGDLCLRLDGLHSKWVKKRGNSDVTQEIWKQNTTLKRMNSWIDMEAWKNEQGMHRTLGWAIGILGHRQCRQSRDYFLALGKMLDFVPTQDPLILVEDRFQYFLSLAKHALLLGDYSPLLFIPPSAEIRDDRAPWLRGYSTAGWEVWDLGRCHRKATYDSIIRNGRVQPTLETVGVIEWFEYFGFEGEARSVVDHILSKTVRAQGHDPKALCEAMDRIFPLDKRKGVNMNWKDTEQDHAQIYDLHKIQDLLEEYGSFLDAEVGQKATVKRLEIVKKITILLKLNKRGSYARESRLDMAAGEAGWFLREYGKAMEGIGQVSCKICGRRSIFRITAWEELKPDAAQVYRIPGLLYDDTVPGGVGIVVQENRILGKTMYATPACACGRLETVELGVVEL
ncbi:unnamed protein product [Clonostachys solani]|uniref:Heterokaryon incompatibility domain-containing protein n=1 Tax=Clonostachys solani TaxID=160281 RepID=A0A9N9Z738_9HYPO|nr:unnamed protein product [Clonostachys solani]